MNVGLNVMALYNGDCGTTVGMSPIFALAQLVGLFGKLSRAPSCLIKDTHSLLHACLPLTTLLTYYYTYIHLHTYIQIIKRKP